MPPDPLHRCVSHVSVRSTQRFAFLLKSPCVYTRPWHYKISGYAPRLDLRKPDTISHFKSSFLRTCQFHALPLTPGLLHTPGEDLTLLLVPTPGVIDTCPIIFIAVISKQ